MNMTTRILIALVLAAAMPLPAVAQPYPHKVIKMILPFPAGSATDGVSRYIGAELQKSLGQPVIIENLPGADGIIAAQAAKRAPADGYTLFVSTNSAHGANPAIYTTLPYDPEKDFEPVAGLIRIPQLMAVRKDFPADDVASFIKLAKERPAGKELTFGSGNTSSRVAAELVKVAGNIPMTEIPYKGTPQALQDLVGGQIDMFFVDPFAGMGLITGGKLKVLALTDTTRLPVLPNVPTMAEAGYKDVQVVSFAAVFAPAKTDPAIVERLNQEINRILQQPQTKAQIQKMGATTLELSPSEAKKFVSGEIVRWGKLVELAGIPKKN
ncbi:MAG: tripartite tricarboxylate transporter substrate binding protein [Burkholderiales bacterium]|nr:tripartite tricarboxylate transporter substrate binding protein [Burkholderiales bacterium]